MRPLAEVLRLAKEDSEEPIAEEVALIEVELALPATALIGVIKKPYSLEK